MMRKKRYIASIHLYIVFATLMQIIKFKLGDQFKSGLTIYTDIDNDFIYNVLRGL
jgi:hypothetical protein